MRKGKNGPVLDALIHWSSCCGKQSLRSFCSTTKAGFMSGSLSSLNLLPLTRRKAVPHLRKMISLK